MIVAAALRLWNIGAGIPNGVGQDEPHIMDRVVRMMKTGDFNPHFFDWPSLTFYLNLVVTVGAFLLGSMRGAWSHLDQVSADQFYLAGRQFTALVGTATVALTFAAGRRWSIGVGVFAAAFMAVMPNHVRESHYVLTDIPTAFFTTLALVLALRAGERGTRASILLAAVAAGFAASCKYNGAMSVVFPLVAVLRMGGAWSFIAGRLGLVAAAALGGFLVGTPVRRARSSGVSERLRAPGGRVCARSGRRSGLVDLPQALFEQRVDGRHAGRRLRVDRGTRSRF